MKIEQILRLIVMAIVLMVAFSLLGFIFKIASGLLSLGLKVLGLLLVVAIIIRFVEAFKQKRKR